jgi:Protein of unknown function (DUF4254)
MSSRPGFGESWVNVTSTHSKPDTTTRDSMPADSLRDLTTRDLLSAVRQFCDFAQSWHCKAPDTSPAAGSIATKALHLHAMNFDLWHHEDALRRLGADDHEVAHRKRVIDDLNARRHAAIEDIDATLFDRFNRDRNQSARLHTETPGMIVDRLSVLTLRIVHTNRAEQRSPRLAILGEQYEDLLVGLEQFLTGMRSGEIGFKLYRQFKSAGQRSYCALFETPEA